MAVSEDIDIVEPVNQNLQAEAPLGEVLSAARIAKKLTQQDVSNSLRFSIKQIDALENNQFSALPDAMITRGFIRNYARLLELDAEPLLASYRGRMPDKQPGTLSVQSSMRQVQLTKDSLPWLKYILGSIVVLLFLLAWFFYMDHQSKTADTPADQAAEAPVAQPTEEAAAVEVPLPEIALPAAERLAGEDAAGMNGADLSAAGTEVSAVTATAMQPQANLPANAASQSATAALPNVPTASLPTAAVPVSGNPSQAGQVVPNVNTVTSAEMNRKNVSLSVTEQTWVSVTDKSGKVVFEKMLPTGSAESFEGVPPLNVVIGNAKAAKLTYAGQPVDFTAQTRGNVARVRLE